MISLKLGIRHAEEIGTFGVEDARRTECRECIDRSLIMTELKGSQRYGVAICKGIRHIVPKRLKDFESLRRIVGLTVEPADIESLNG